MTATLCDGDSYHYV